MEKSKVEVMSREIGKMIGLIEGSGFIHIDICESVKVISKEFQDYLDLEIIKEEIRNQYKEYLLLSDDEITNSLNSELPDMLIEYGLVKEG